MLFVNGTIHHQSQHFVTRTSKLKAWTGAAILTYQLKKQVFAKKQRGEKSLQHGSGGEEKQITVLGDPQVHLHGTAMSSQSAKEELL